MDCMSRLTILLFVTVALAQPPVFEVATIKPSTPQSVRGSEGGPGSSDPTRYRFSSAALLEFIAIAWHVEYFQVAGKVSLDGPRYDIVANVPAGATRNQFREMLKALLIERFHLKYHTETRDFPAYELSVARNGPKLNAPAPAGTEGFPDLPPNRAGYIANHSPSGRYTLVRLRAQQQPVSVLSNALHTTAGRPIVDKTGFSGKYDFTLAFTTDMPGAPPSAGDDPPVAPDLFTAIQQQLGLQLTAKKLPFSVIVVDAVDKVPGEN